jgi:hypothetical protein
MYTRALFASAGLDAAAGAWLFLSALLFHHGVDYLFINNLTSGAFAMVLAFGAFAHVWFAWLPAVLGAWVIMSPFVLGFADNLAGTVNNVLTGVIILVLAVRSHSVASAAHDAGVSGE